MNPIVASKIDKACEGGQILRMDGFDDCIMGICSRFGADPVLAYNRRKVIKKLMSQGMTREEAWEFHEFNQLGAWMGEGTPVFIDVL